MQRFRPKKQAKAVHYFLRKSFGVNGIGNAIKNVWNGIVGAIKGAINSIISAINSMIVLHHPSAAVTE